MTEIEHSIQSTLILGGARSGKSEMAEKIAESSCLPLTYLATASRSDNEMRHRITKHQSRRGENWALTEEPIHIADVIDAASGGTMLIDCMTLWLSNLMERGLQIDSELETLTSSINAATSTIIFVSNELGMGLVPENALSRRFRDAHGLMNQTLARECNIVLFSVSGLPLVLKGDMPKCLIR